MSVPYPLETLAALVATVLVQCTKDPVGEIDPTRDGFARRVERHVLAQLLERHQGSMNSVALATRGKPVGSTLQRNFARHADLASTDPAIERAVYDLLHDAPGAWGALIEELDDVE